MITLLSKVFLQICSNFSVSMLLLTLGFKTLQEFLYWFWYSRLKKSCGDGKMLQIFSGIQTQWHQLQLMTFGMPKTKEKVHIHHALWYT
jgi:hypothetical protein